MGLIKKWGLDLDPIPTGGGREGGELKHRAQQHSADIWKFHPLPIRKQRKAREGDLPRSKRIPLSRGRYDLAHVRETRSSVVDA
jgi:hypothetical protein